MNLTILTPDLEVTYACGRPQGEPRGAFSRFLHELGVDRCTVILGGAQEPVRGVMPSPPSQYFSDGGKKA